MFPLLRWVPGKGLSVVIAQLIPTGLGTSQGSTCLAGRDGLGGWLLGAERGNPSGAT